MKTISLLTLLLMAIPQGQTPVTSNDGLPVTVLSIKWFSLSGPQDVVSVNILAKKPGSLGAEQVRINRVEFADGSIWQRKDWNFGEVRLSYAHAVATPWGTEMCRSL